MAKYKQYKLPDWCKRAQIAMIRNDISIDYLAEVTGYCRQHVNAVLNGRLISEKAISKISDCLGISNEHD